MRRTPTIPTVPIALGLVLSLGLGSAPADVVDEYVSQALQGDLSGAAALFDSLDPDRADDRERKLAEHFRKRFRQGEDESPLPEDPFVKGVVLAYRDYWRRALLRESDPDAAEELLFDELGDLLRVHGIAQDAPRDEILDRMGEGLDRAGYHHLSGRTLPHLELMLWARQDTARYEVELTDEVRSVNVIFLRDFRVRGWAHFATFGRASTGGWATKEALFCLADDYDLDSERFRVSYLQHEARHFADYDRFPRLEQIDLEYRGKLTELVYADTSLTRLVEHFARSAERNPEAPHAFANEAVVRGLSREVFGEELVGEAARWRSVDPEVIHAAARRLLERNTRELEEAGAASTTGVVRQRT